MRTIKIVKILLMLGFFFGVLCLLIPQATPLHGAAPAPNKDAKKSKTNPQADLSLFVGNESCADCHANESAHFSVTAHRKTLSESFPVDQRGCEACHGGGKRHVEFHKAAQKLYEEGKATEAEALMADTEKAKAAKLVYFKELTSEQASAACLTCHENQQGRSEERFNFRRSEHHRQGVSCLDCHSSHSPGRTEFLLREEQPGLCYSCHADQKAAFNRPFHHKVPEGTMKCTDCHNQHGGFQSKQLRSWVGNDVTCLKCHADKSGPFVYEHAPVKVEGCQACHTPHGSTNPRLLTRNDVRFLCLECHSNTPQIKGEEQQGGVPTPSFHNLSLPRFQNCTTCHRMIHGSNTHPVFFR